MIRYLSALLLSLSALSTQAEEVSIPHAGLNLNAQFERHASDWSSKPVVLLVHGTLAHNSMEIMQTLQGALKDREYSSLAINLSLGLDQRHGMYDCKVAHTHKHSDAAVEIQAWMKWLQEQGAKDIVLMGHSRGGNQVAQAAAQAPAGLRGSILIAPMTWSAEYATKDYEKRYGQALTPLLNKAQDWVNNGKGQALMSPVDFVYCEDTKASASAFVSYYATGQQLDTPSVVATLSSPVQVFIGPEDNSVKGLQAAMEALPARDGLQIEVIDGADHFFRDLYAEDVADMAVEFIEGL